MSEHVIVAVEGRVGRLRLDRPEALHAHTEAMCRTMIDALLAWRTDNRVEAVLIDHAAGRGFCAGGDVRTAAESGRGDGAVAHAFFATEYQLNHLLYVYAKPILAVMDGVTMGGGVGLALPARYRIATERTMFAMPETTIGLFPDAGAGRYLSRLPGRMGEYLALTSARLDGAECLALGLATHFVPSARIEEAKQALIADPRAADAILAAFAEAPPAAAILDRIADIDRLFAADRLEDMIDALAADSGAWAAATLANLRIKSPTSCKVALRELRAARHLTDFADEMRMEYGLAWHLCQRHDFIEGVRALLVDKDNAPRWDPSTPEGVTDTMLDTIFAPLPPEAAWEPLRL
ncbi:enoyl-CoA hydratase/isomerase family protein [Sphingomonas nostoxanthinifaciens]|uniref:enoyl-CoA hydratase/isomerase family protein n=1 Tax=Sphingomonas nostoxanthinifaciens TaxID=2872652 RepID=UPI001CC1ECC4|nr:enoyl-CoA hydratase/isomerase family protein [Sphingomonas nostoxanthinifaciens]UAK23364.1 enoyl-CoA hydratase/isomerase family protein [Sphingomonas nostoxanthinifaciens]